MKSTRIVAQCPCSPERRFRIWKDSTMPINVTIGQKWAAWVPGRRQWLLTTVIGNEAGQIILQFDKRYGIGAGDDEERADEATMLSTANRFRFIAA